MSASADLTENQRLAVEHRDGPLLVLAGPGSGKTRVITRRVARLVETGVPPRQILAITFTNKAAREMAERIAALLPDVRIHVSTFHSFCARLLRQYASSVGLQPNFTILDTSDQQAVVRRVLQSLDLDPTAFPPARLAYHISRAKNDLQTAAVYAEAYSQRIANNILAVVAQVYPRYQQRLLELNAVDFDDLLVHVAMLLHENEELRAALDERYRYVLVDEYQDTNIAQYRIVVALSQDYPNLCVTGDPDQSIYGWRGARIDNILRFEADFPDAAVIRLEENFRSTPEILQVADSLIQHNRQRKRKALVPSLPSGDPVRVVLLDDGVEEADWIARQIKQQVFDEGRRWSEFAIFYRVNALSRELEVAFRRHGIPYQVAAGVAFFERTEIKDMLAYLRVIQNPADAVAFERVVNIPRRGIGKQTVSRLIRWSESSGMNPLEAARHADACPDLSKRAVQSLKKFAGMIDELVRESAGPVTDLLRSLVRRTGYLEGYYHSESEEDRARVANVEELLTAASHYEASADDPSLEGFLESASLASAVDNVDEAAGAVTLMTLHAAKGLEYPSVYLIGLEQNLIPHDRALRENDPRELEEERRLLFVGITRAMKQLTLTFTRARDQHGRRLTTIPSEFLAELNLPVTDLSTGGPMRSVEEFRQQLERLGDGDAKEELPVAPSAPLPQHRRPTGAAPAAGLGFSVGMQVRHPQYGLGTVVSTSGTPSKQNVTVVFDDGQEGITFRADKCPLQPVGIR